MKQGIHPTYYPDATGDLRLRKHLDDRLDEESHPHRRVLELPPLLHRRAAHRGHGRPGGPLLQEAAGPPAVRGRRRSPRIGPHLPRPADSRARTGHRPTEALAKAGITTVGQVLDKMELGETRLLAVEGFGRKSLADLKKKLRSFGYELPEAAEEIVV